MSAGEPSERAVWLARRVVGPVVKLAFRPRLEGLEHLPDGPFLLVANHSAGVGAAELASFASLYLEHLGPARPLAGFAHPLGFEIWPMTMVHRALGTVPSTYEAAYETLAVGVPLLVFPGGDHESLTPFWRANRVDFAGRVGFLRIAKEADVPIVPMGIRGGAYTAPILFRARWLAWALVLPRLTGIKRWGMSVLSALVGAAACVAAGLGIVPWWAAAGLFVVFAATILGFLPWVPATLRFRIGTPIAANRLPDELDEALEQVERAVQDEVDGRGRQSPQT